MTEPEFNDELLSAYLDGELDDAERAVVEARLAEDAAARQLFEELRSVSNSVRALPREVTSPGVRESILSRVAERSERTPTDGVTPLRRLMWPLMAVAALLLLMFTQGEQDAPEVGDVAVVRPGEVDQPVDRDAADERVTLEGEGAAASRERAFEPEILSRDSAVADRTPSAEAPPAVGELRSFGEPAGENRPAVALDHAAPAPATVETEGSVAMRSGGFGGTGEFGPMRTAGLEGDVALVHLTVKNIRDGNERFNRVLRGNGIVVLDDSAAVSRSEPARAESSARRIGAEDGGAEQESSANSYSSSRRVATPPSATRLVAEPEEKGQTLAEAQMVMVEAPPEQMEQLLQACKQDSEAIEEVVIDEATTAQVSPAATEQLSRYRSFNKVMPKKAKSESFDITPAQRGVIAVLNSLPTEQSELSQPLQQSVAAEQNRAWAAPIRDYREAEQYQQLRLRNQSIMPQSSGGREGDLGTKPDRDSGSLDAAKDELQPAAEPHVRVLFLLHPRSDE